MLLNDGDFGMADFERIRQFDVSDTFPRSGPHRKYIPVGVFIMCGWTSEYYETFTLSPVREVNDPPYERFPMPVQRFGHIYRPL
jgi:hypothetical protein